MTQKMLNAILSAALLKDYDHHAWFGVSMANKRNHKRYLRKNHLGKFSKGKSK